MADARDGPVELPARLAEAEAVEQRHRPGAHRDDVAEDAADPGGSALEGLDRRRVVVALDLEGDRLAVTEVEHARVLARPLQDARAGGRQPLHASLLILCIHYAQHYQSFDDHS